MSLSKKQSWEVSRTKILTLPFPDLTNHFSSNDLLKIDRHIVFLSKKCLASASNLNFDSLLTESFFYLIIRCSCHELLEVDTHSFGSLNFRVPNITLKVGVLSDLNIWFCALHLLIIDTSNILIWIMIITYYQNKYRSAHKFTQFKKISEYLYHSIFYSVI